MAIEHRRPKDMNCPKCKNNIRNIGPSGVCWTYCKQCTRSKIRQKTPNGKCSRCKNRERYVASTGHVRLYCKPCSLADKYKITGDELIDLYNQQNKKCLVCNNLIFIGRGNKTNRTGHIDHCHVTGKIRGILCHVCNNWLGHFKDNPELLRKAANYLENNI